MSISATDILDTYDLSIMCEKVESNPFMPQDSSDLDHWFCTLKNDSVTFDFYLSRGADFLGSAPTAEFALSFILEDIGSFRLCEGYEEFCKMIGIDMNDTKAQLAYDELSRLSDNLEIVLSSEVNKNIIPSI